MNRMNWYVRSFAITLAGMLGVTGALTRAQARADGSTPADVAWRVQDAMDRGVNAYNLRDYQSAIDHFQSAAALAPQLTAAKAYLATALGQTVTPLLEQPANLALERRVVKLLRQVLAVEPRNAIARRGLAKAYFDRNQLDKARTWAFSTLDLDPLDPYAAYIVGVADWTEVHENVIHVFRQAGLQDDEEGNKDAPVYLLETIRVENADLIGEMIRSLELAVEVRPDYEDAMRYLSLAFRRKADLEYGNSTADARDADLASAKQWIDRAMEIRNAKTRQRQTLGPASMPNLRQCVIFRNMMAPTRCVPVSPPKNTSENESQP